MPPLVLPDNPTVEPFDATVNGVRALLPEATIYDALPAGRKGVTVAQVTAWLTELSNRVDLRLAAWRRLRSVATDEEEIENHPAPRARFESAARDLVHNGAASYTEAARYPERASVADTSYAGVLWSRFTTGLSDLESWLEEELATGEDTGTGGDTATGTPGYHFPPAYPWEQVRF